MKIKAGSNKIIYFEKVDSTNEEAEKLLFSRLLEEYTVIVTDFQLKGKGVGRNTWQSDPAMNILMSIVLHPEFLNPADQFMINKVVSLAVCECIAQFLPEKSIYIKWPNDIYVEDRKIAGILSKNIIMGHQFSSCIVGIGLNVNQITFDPDVPNPVSLAQLTGSAVDRESVLGNLTDQIKTSYERLRSGNFGEIDQDYLSTLLNYNLSAIYESHGKRFEGIIRNVDPFGRLILETGGEIKKYDMKEITLISNKISP